MISSSGGTSTNMPYELNYPVSPQRAFFSGQLLILDSIRIFQKKIEKIFHEKIFEKNKFPYFGGTKHLGSHFQNQIDVNNSLIRRRCGSGSPTSAKYPERLYTIQGQQLHAWYGIRTVRRLTAGELISFFKAIPNTVVSKSMGIPTFGNRGQSLTGDFRIPL